MIEHMTDLRKPSSEACVTLRHPSLVVDGCFLVAWWSLDFIFKNWNESQSGFIFLVTSSVSLVCLEFGCLIELFLSHWTVSGPLWSINPVVFPKYVKHVHNFHFENFKLGGIRNRRWSIFWSLLFCFFQDRIVDQRKWTKQNWYLRTKFFQMLILRVIWMSQVITFKPLTILWLGLIMICPLSLNPCPHNRPTVEKFLYLIRMPSNLLGVLTFQILWTAFIN